MCITSYIIKGLKFFAVPTPKTTIKRFHCDAAATLHTASASLCNTNEILKYHNFQGVTLFLPLWISSRLHHLSLMSFSTLFTPLTITQEIFWVSSYHSCFVFMFWVWFPAHMLGNSQDFLQFLSASCGKLLHLITSLSLKYLVTIWSYKSYPVKRSYTINYFKVVHHIHCL